MLKKIKQKIKDLMLEILIIIFYNLKRNKIFKDFFNKFLYNKEILAKEKKDIVFVLFYDSGCYRLNELLNKLELKGLKTKCLSLSSKEWINSILKFRLIKFFFYLGWNIYVIVFYFILEKYEPLIVVVQNDTFPKKLKIFMNRMGVRIINLAHGITFPTELFSSLNYDFYFMFGKKSYENLINNKYIEKNNIEKLEIILSGSPFFERKEILEWDKRLFIVVAGCYFPREYYNDKDYEYFINFYKSVNFLIKKYNSYYFLYKPHPARREIDLEYEYILKNDNVILLDSSENIYKILRFSKLLISDVSVSTLEAAAAGCPFIVFDWMYSKNKDYFCANEMGDIMFFERATNFEELEKLFLQRVSKDFFINSQDKLYSYYK
ncbi:MAG: hypothetical protein ACP5RD_07900, partial [bacterium]